MHDLVIRDALIYDGTGAAPRHGALAVADGRIAAIGDDVGGGAEEIAADGLALAPGIIDTHTHYDAQITWDPWLSPSSGLGVTTVVMGNCGFTVAPCRPGQRDQTLRNLCNVEGMSVDALHAGMRWDFETFPQYLDSLAAAGPALNVAVFAGHSSLRTWVMGEAASERAAGPDEVAAMAALLREAMAAGAIGFSTSTFEGHNGAGGVPMPSRLADENELMALTVAMGESGHGVFMLTRGSHTRLRFLESLAEASKRPVIVAAILHDRSQPDAAARTLARIGEARARGNELYGQVSCCPLTMEFPLRNPYLMESYDAWAPAREAAPEALEGVYRDPAFRAAMKAELGQRGKLRAFAGDWSGITVVAAAVAAQAGAEGRDIAAMAAAEGKHPLDCFLDFGLKAGLDTMFASLLLNTDQEAVGALITDPCSTIALSDAGAHLTFFCDAGFALYLYGHWARDAARLPLEQAVHEMTGRQADIFRIRDRGRLVPGAFADLMLFDPATVGRTPSRRVHDLPAGASRLVCGAEGLHGAWVNGVRVADANGVIGGDGARAGTVLRDFAA